MSDEKALLAAIWEHPHDDTVRLVYADWLQENGQSERAEFIRVQCEIAQDVGGDRCAELREREKALWDEHAPAWRVHLPERWRDDTTFHRGFPRLDLSMLTFDDLIKLKPKDLRVAPLSRYHYNLRGSEFNAFLKWPGAVFQDLFAPRPYPPRGWTDRLARCDKLRNVSEVAFIDQWLAPGEIKVILDTWADRHLTSLALAGRIEDVGAMVVAGHRASAKLRELDLRSAGLTPVGLRTLGRSPNLGRLRFLNLWDNRFGDPGAVELAASLLPSVRGLNLNKTEIGDAGATALANSPAVANLWSLAIGRNNIGTDGLRALARSPHLGQVKRLVVADNPGTADPGVQKELRDRFGDRVSV
jgi:uncharacterized protein (TIGR02996 family)